MKKILVEQPNNKVFTYIVSEYSVDNNFISFIDKFKGKRLIPLTRVIEVIEDE